jgi:hypothetical protein
MRNVFQRASYEKTRVMLLANVTPNVNPQLAKTAPQRS